MKETFWMWRDAVVNADTLSEVRRVAHCPMGWYYSLKDVRDAFQYVGGVDHLNGAATGAFIGRGIPPRSFDDAMSRATHTLFVGPRGGLNIRKVEN